MTYKQKMHVKIGDQVKVISGSHKGKNGKIIQVLRKSSLVIIKNINLKTKHKKAQQEGETGKIITFEAPIHSSNVVKYTFGDPINS